MLRQNGDELATAQVLGPALSTDSAVIGQAFLALVVTNAASLVPGSSIIAQIDTGAREGGVVLPRDAVVRHAGQGWVYVETGPHTFTRRPVPLDRPHSDGWLVPGQWTQPIIISGAQSLLSEELKGSIQMGELMLANAGGLRRRTLRHQRKPETSKALSVAADILF